MKLKSQATLMVLKVGMMPTTIGMAFVMFLERKIAKLSLLPVSHLFKAADDNTNSLHMVPAKQLICPHTELHMASARGLSQDWQKMQAIVVHPDMHAQEPGCHDIVQASHLAQNVTYLSCGNGLVKHSQHAGHNAVQVCLAGDGGAV